MIAVSETHKQPVELQIKSNKDNAEGRVSLMRIVK